MSPRVLWSAHRTYSFKGAMTVTVSWSLTKSEAMRLSTAFVRATFVEFECHAGGEIRRPELSKLTDGGMKWGQNGSVWRMLTRSGFQERREGPQ